jgi:hypothetical protein
MTSRIADLWARPDVRRTAVAVAIALTATYSIAYTSLQYIDSDNFAGNSDILLYMAIARGEEVESDVSRESRALTIWLVKVLPNLPGSAFASGRVVDDEWRLKVKFAAVNSAFLVGTAVLMWLYTRKTGFSVPESYLAMLLFLVSWTVVYQGAIPLVDPSSFFFIAFGAVAIAYRNLWLFGAVLLLGLFAKESVAVIAPLAAVSVDRQRLRWIGVSVGAAVPFVAWRLLSGDEDSTGLGHLDPDHIRHAIEIIPDYFRFNIAAEVVATFGLLWALAAYAFFTGRLPAEMRRQYLWVVAVAAMAVFLASGLGRTIFLAFPVIIPSAVIGIRHLVGSSDSPRHG